MSSSPPKKKVAHPECVKVVVRLRPLSSQEQEANKSNIFQVNGRQITINDPATDDGRHFTFDAVYDTNFTQTNIFDETAKPIVESVLAGYNGTLFAYGQTGTGKTYTMEGVFESRELWGITPNSFDYIFQTIKNKSSNTEFMVRCSFIEIYQDEVYDLLNRESVRKKMKVRESEQKGIFVKDLSAYVVRSARDMQKLLSKGSKARQTGATEMNKGSSRSHSIFQVTVETAVKQEKGQTLFRAGKLNMVDLAGSERQAKTKAQGQRLLEARSINLSLTALGNVIEALVSKKPGTHIPFRDSKLTRLLSDSLGGNTKTVMIANLGPSQDHYSEGLNTLRYAHRAKDIKNKPVVNEDPKDALLRKMLEEIDELKKQLELRQNPGAGTCATSDHKPGEATPREVVYEEKIVEKEKVIVSGVDPAKVREMEAKHRAEAAALKAQAQAEKDKILTEAQIAEEAAKVYEEQLALHMVQLEKEKKEADEIAEKIAQKESELIVGGQIMEKAEQDRIALEDAQRMIREREEEEQRLHCELQEVVEAEKYLSEQLDSKKKTLEVQTHNLKILWDQLKKKKMELADLQDEFLCHREELLDDIREVQQEISHRNILAEYFIPPPIMDLLLRSAHYDPYNDQWIIPHMEHAGNNIQRDHCRQDRRNEQSNISSPKSPGEYISFSQPSEIRRSQNGSILSVDKHYPMLGNSNPAQKLQMQIPSDQQLKNQQPYYSYGGEKKGSRRVRKH